jgi:hypothetical protein
MPTSELTRNDLLLWVNRIEMLRRFEREIFTGAGRSLIAAHFLSTKLFPFLFVPLCLCGEIPPP